MKHLLFKITLIFPISILISLILTQVGFSQLNSNDLKQSSLRNEQSILNLKTTIEEGMNYLDNIDDNYLTKISGLITYDRVYLAKNSEKLFFSKKALDSLRMPKMNRELKCLSEAIYFEARGEQIEDRLQ